MTNQQYSHLLQAIVDLGQQMADGFAVVNARLDRHEVILRRHDKFHAEHRRSFAGHDRNFASIYEILQEITNHLPIETPQAKQ